MLSEPRFHSPIDGIIQRVRPLQAGTTVPNDTNLVEISSFETSNYEVVFGVSLERASLIETGDQISVRPLGLADRHEMKLVGDVIEIHTAPNSETTDQA